MTQSHITVFGIKTCDTCRKALKALDAQNVTYIWSDLRKDAGPEQSLINILVEADQKGALKAINKSSKTWRDMDYVSRETFSSGTLTDRADLLVKNPLLIKRPLIVANGKITCGWSDDILTQLKTSA
ncbi:MAG: arsenate reductase family protein [Alphaproteobacteria bacterium]